MLNAVNIVQQALPWMGDSNRVTSRVTSRKWDFLNSPWIRFRAGRIDPKVLFEALSGNAKIIEPGGRLFPVLSQSNHATDG